MHNVVLAVTGASGAIYAVRLLEVLLASGKDVHLTFSQSAVTVFEHELGIRLDLDNFDPRLLLPAEDDLREDSALSGLCAGVTAHFALSSVFSESDIASAPGSLNYYHNMDFSAGIASGSFSTDAMVICPCSMGTLASIAHGHSSNLIQRAADVHLKEHRKLIVVPRETPLSSIQLDNMKRLADAGAIVMPAAPGFYHEPMTIHDLVDFMVSRICDHVGVRQELMKRWGD